MKPKLVHLALTVGLVACGPSTPSALTPDAGPPVDSGISRVDASDEAARPLPAGLVTEDLCGRYTVEGDLEVPPSADVTICAGSVLTFASDARFDIRGRLFLAGTGDQPIQLDGSGRWAGLSVEGTLEADHTSIFDAELALHGRVASSVRFDHGLIDARATRNARLENGATLEFTTIRGGGSVRVEGGVLRMTRSVIDLDHAGISPDCTIIGGDTEVQIDHSLITNCHCPIHINGASGGASITNSILDGAAYPVMVRSAGGTFRGNVFEGTAAHIQDIGGGIDIDIAGNYYAGDIPILDTDNPAQFRNVDQALAERPADVGP